MNKNAGLKERSASKPTVPPEEAEPYPWLEEQVPEDTGKLSCNSGLMCLSPPGVLVGSFQNHVLPIVLQCLQNCEVLFKSLLKFYGKQLFFLVKIYTG